MNNDTIMDALRGGINPNLNGDDRQKELDELKHKLQVAQVEQGRVKKLSDENADLKRRIAELEAKKEQEDLLSAISEEEREMLPDGTANAAAKLAAKAAARVERATQEKLNELEARQNARIEEERKNLAEVFKNKIKAEFPDFIQSISSGGSNENAWAKYSSFNSDTLTSALNSFNYETMSWHIKNFYQNFLHSPISTAGNGKPSTVDPTAGKGGSGSQISVTIDPTKTYTAEEYAALEKKAERAYEDKDYKTYNEITRELETALSEGRVK